MYASNFRAAWYVATKLMCRAAGYVATKLMCRAAGYVATKLLCRLICNLPELSIRIFQSDYFLFFINRYESRIADPDIQYSRIAHPAEH